MNSAHSSNDVIAEGRCDTPAVNARRSSISRGTRTSPTRVESEQPVGPFRDQECIGGGACGVVFSAIGPDDKLVAIKQELASVKVTRTHLEHEYHVLKALGDHECIPKAIAYGRLGKTKTLVMDLLGQSLDFSEFRAEKIGLAATAHLALGMLDAVQYVHSRGFIHRDIKPSNFVVGRGDKSHFVYLIDFGLARRWRDVTDETSVHGEHRIIGTPHYVSVHTHLGQEQTRRDDLHALTYTIISLVCGDLPWSCVTQGTNKHHSQRILKKKQSWTAARLCQDLPLELQLFSSHCLSLAIGDEPDYQFLRNQLATLASRERCADVNFKWEGRVAFKKPDIVPSLDYETAPRCIDPSFFPYQLSFPEEAFPYRPAVVCNVIVPTNDPVYFTLDLYPIMRRASLNGLSKHRWSCFQQLEMVVENATGKSLPFHDLYLYKTRWIGYTIVEYSQAASIQATQVYDSDDSETRTVNERLPKVFDRPRVAVMEMRPWDVVDLTDGTGVNTSGCNSWNSEMIYVDEIRKQENGFNGTGDDHSDDDIDFNDCSMDFCGWPLPSNRRLSCTVSVAGPADRSANGLHSPT
ncbi:kinase-like domain-containing protein [Cyathus striatus]|nr:kinase-like domain-containing protein [Cyathus striatus]